MIVATILPIMVALFAFCFIPDDSIMVVLFAFCFIPDDWF